jgi:hypothetical protein
MTDAAPASAPASQSNGAAAPPPAAPPTAAPAAKPRADMGNFHERMQAKNDDFVRRIESERFGGKKPANNNNNNQQQQSAREHITEVNTELQKPAEQNQDPTQQAAQGEQPVDEDDALEAPAPPIDPQEAASKYKEWTESPDLPPDFKNKLVEVKWGPHGTKLVTVDEAIKGYQRLGESTRVFQQAQAREAEAKRNAQVYDQHFEAIKDPSQFLEIYERNGYGDVLYKVAEMIAQRDLQDNQLVQAAGYAAMRQFQTDAKDYRVREAMDAARQRLVAQRQQEVEMRKLQAERDRLLQQHKQVDEQQQVAQLTEKFRAQLAQLVPIAFKAHGVRDNQINRAKHHRLLTDLMQATNATDITRQLVMDATSMLLEEISDARGAANGTNGRPPLGTQRLGSGTGAATIPNGAQRQGKRLDSFFDDMRKRNGQ